MLKIYHNPRCRKSRAGLEHLQASGAKFEVIDYLKTGLSQEQIKEILLKMNISPADLVRNQEDIYKKELKGRNFNDNEWIVILSENPKLLQRPVIVSEHKAVLGQPPEKINILL